VLAALISFREPFTEVEVRGNVLVPAETILHHLGTPDRETLPAAFQRLFDTGLFRLVQGSIEYVLAPGSRLRFVGFFDLGNVYATDFEGLELPGVRYDAGGEAQILAPIGNVPVRIGYGFNLDPVEDEPRGRFFVSLAFRF